MDKAMYCITHEEWAIPPLMDYVPTECVWTTTEPPVLPDGWENTVEEPGSDELFVMNVRARQLLVELEG